MTKVTVIATALSLIIPGLGQVFLGDIKKGVIFFIVAVLVANITFYIFKSWSYSIIELLIAIYAAYDAYRMAQEG